MKVLMINSVSGYGSTGSICVDIAVELESLGHDCYIAFGQVSRGYKKEFKIGTHLENHLHNLGSRLLGKQGYFTKNGTKDLVAFIKKYDPDIIHLHNLHGNYLNLKILFEYLNKAQVAVIWTLHDCWPFTGKCAHFNDAQCFKWMSECGNCPQVDKYPPSLFFDFSKEMHRDKKEMVAGLKNLTIIPVSFWLESQVKQSFLNPFLVETIYNWVDHSVFKPVLDCSFAKDNAISADKFNIIIVSAGWHQKDNKFIDALALSKIIADDMQIIMVGKMDTVDSLPINIIHIPYLESKEKLAEAYSFADVYVHLSTEDTFGKVIAEAMSCGTPAIVYNSTACPEIVGEECGYIVEKRNLMEVYEKLKKIQCVGKSFYSLTCRKHVIDNFDKKSNILKTLATYKSAIL